MIGSTLRMIKTVDGWLTLFHGYNYQYCHLSFEIQDRTEMKIMERQKNSVGNRDFNSLNLLQHHMVHKILSLMFPNLKQMKTELSMCNQTL